MEQEVADSERTWNEDQLDAHKPRYEPREQAAV